MLELAREADFPFLSRLALEVQNQHAAWRPDLYRSGECPFDESYLRECIQEKRLFVAKVGDISAGFVLFRTWKTGGPGNVPRKIMDIDSIAVDAPFRSQGIGTQMMAELRVLAKAFGCTDLQLSVYPQNDEAVSFYQKCGFTIRNINMQTKL